MSNKQQPPQGNIEQKSPSAHQFQIQQNDEIDLMALFSILLKHKFLILIFTVVCIVVSVGVVKLLPQKWSSTAIVIPPASEELKKLTHLKLNWMY